MLLQPAAAASAALASRKLLYRSFISALFLRYLSFISALSQLYRSFIAALSQLYRSFISSFISRAPPPSGYLTVISRLSHGYLTVISRLSHGYLAVISRLSQLYLAAILRLSCGYPFLFLYLFRWPKTNDHQNSSQLRRGAGRTRLSLPT